MFSLQLYNAYLILKNISYKLSRLGCCGTELFLSFNKGRKPGTNVGSHPKNYSTCLVLKLLQKEKKIYIFGIFFDMECMQW